MKTIDKIITKCDTRRGAPMGRSNTIPQNYTIVKNVGAHDYLVYLNNKESKVVFDCAVPMCDGAYDKGGAYWGIGEQLRVSYTKDLSYIEFYRGQKRK